MVIFLILNIGKSKLNLLYKHMNEYNVINFDIILIENYPCENRTQLSLREEVRNNNIKSLNFHNSFLSRRDTLDVEFMYKIII